MFNPLVYLENPFALIPLALTVLAVVHAVRAGNFLWIYVILFLPGIGSLIYIAVEIVYPVLRGRAGQRIKSGASAMLDPNRDYRQAQRDVEMVGSIDAKRALAEQLVQRGQMGEAIALYEGMLQQPIYKDDAVLLVGLARARFRLGDGAGAQAALDQLQAADPKFVSEEAHMIYAHALELQGKDADAVTEYANLARYFAGEEARTREAVLLEKMGRRDEARALYEQVVKNLDGAPGRYRTAQKEWGDIAKAALRR